MTTYVDSSTLVAVYVSEQFSDAARDAVRAVARVPFTALHELEVFNAFERLVGAGAITLGQCLAVQDQLREDLDSQRLTRLSLNLDRLFLDASELSRAYTSRFLTRSLDLLHIAAAHAAGCTAFVSADDRQLAVAKATGLAVTDIKRGTRRSQS